MPQSKTIEALPTFLIILSLTTPSADSFGFGSMGGGGGGCCVCAPPAPPPVCPPPPVCAPPPPPVCLPCPPPAPPPQSCAPACAPSPSSAQNCAPACAPQPSSSAAQNCAPACAPQPSLSSAQNCAPVCAPQASPSTAPNCVPVCAPQPSSSAAQNCAPACAPQPAPAPMPSSSSSNCAPSCSVVCVNCGGGQSSSPMMGGGSSYAMAPPAPSSVGTYAQPPQPQAPIQVQPAYQPPPPQPPPPPPPPPPQPPPSGSYMTYQAEQTPSPPQGGSYNPSPPAGSYRDTLLGKERGILEPGSKPVVRIIPSTTRSVLLPDPMTAYEDKPPEIDDYEENTRVGAETFVTTTTSPPPTTTTTTAIVAPAGNSSPDEGDAGRTHHSALPKKIKDDQLTDDYTDNSFKAKKLLAAGVPQTNDADNTGDPKCSSETLRQIMQENIVSSPTISKQLIFSAGRLAFGQSIDVVCSKNKFSYTVVSSRIFCESTRKRITCFAFLQP